MTQTAASTDYQEWSRRSYSDSAPATPDYVYDTIWHLYNKFQIGESDICPCNTENMTVEHILGRYPKLKTIRMEIWPEGTHPG
jgi:hypothetical protein